MFTFADVVRGLRRVFPKRLDDHELRQMDADYFKALRRFTLQQVQAGAETWIQRGKYFPKPAEWIDSIPRRTTIAPDISAMSEDEMREYHRAEGLRYEDQACSCRACREAEVSDKPIRFVPDLDRDGRERKLKDGDRIVAAGHWAHGSELARWYQAKGDFYERFYAWIATKTMPSATKALPPSRIGRH